jgi:hypothetical protein
MWAVVRFLNAVVASMTKGGLWPGFFNPDQQSILHVVRLCSRTEHRFEFAETFDENRIPALSFGKLWYLANFPSKYPCEFESLCYTCLVCYSGGPLMGFTEE